MKYTLGLGPRRHMLIGDSADTPGPITSYEVTGLPRGCEATISIRGKRYDQKWQIYQVRQGASTAWTGSHRTAEDALAGVLSYRDEDGLAAANGLFQGALKASKHAVFRSLLTKTKPAWGAKHSCTLRNGLTKRFWRGNRHFAELGE